MITITKRFLSFCLVNLAVLLTPLVAMQFTNDVNWQAGDFILAGLLLFSFALIVEWVLQRKGRSWRSKFWWIALAVVVLVLLWAEMAVGIFGSPIAGS